MINGKPITTGGSAGLQPIIYVNSITGSTISCDGITGTEKAKPNPAYHNLPSGYTEVEWIASDGNQYIDTGVNETGSSKYHLDFQCLVAYSYSTLFGSYGSSTYNRLYLQFNQAATALAVTDGGDGTSFLTSGLLERHTVDIVGSTLTVDGTSSVSISRRNTNTSPALFALHRTGSTYSEATNVRFYSFKSWSDGTNLSCDYVPCKNSSNEYGFYDLVSNTFKGNNGTGAFTGGDIVPATLPYWEFKTSIGTHTIVGQYDGKTQSKTVVVDAVGVYEVEIDYKLWLYKLGDECDDVTGGWDYGHVTSTGIPFFATHNAINLTGYTKLCARGYKTGNPIEYYPLTVGYCNSYTSTSISNDVDVATNYGGSSSDLKLLEGTIDISTSKYVMVINRDWNSSYSGDKNTDNLYLYTGYYNTKHYYYEVWIE